MEAIAKWLERLSSAQAANLRDYLLPVLTPGFHGLDIYDCLIAAEPKGPIPARPGDTSPVSMAILHYVDVAQENINISQSEELAGELAAILSLATDRKINVPNALAFQVEGAKKITFLAYSSAADHRLNGPLPVNPKDTINDLFSKIAGLPPEVQPVLGAAAQLHHSAFELFENDLRAAYILLVAGIEVLSRKFGSPPTDWASWEGSKAWDDTFAAADITEDQRSIFRSKIMHDKQLRLKATFREYASSRLPDTFWDETWESWIYSYNASRGDWEAPRMVEHGVMAEILPRDRTLLSKLLGSSYDTRSGLVHRGDLLGVVESAIPLATTADPSRPLPFSLLRSILGHLIRSELDTFSIPVGLPDFQFIK